MFSFIDNKKELGFIKNLIPKHEKENENNENNENS